VARCVVGCVWWGAGGRAQAGERRWRAQVAGCVWWVQVGERGRAGAGGRVRVVGAGG